MHNQSSGQWTPPPATTTDTRLDAPAPGALLVHTLPGKICSCCICSCCICSCCSCSWLYSLKSSSLLKTRGDSLIPVHSGNSSTTSAQQCCTSHAAHHRQICPALRRQPAVSPAQPARTYRPIPVPSQCEVCLDSRHPIAATLMPHDYCADTVPLRQPAHFCIRPTRSSVSMARLYVPGARRDTESLMTGSWPNWRSAAAKHSLPNFSCTSVWNEARSPCGVTSLAVS